jgi:histidinol-phosphate/aromatic aminotransferase/cobyric acid decarboxylase-like protein
VHPGLATVVLANIPAEIDSLSIGVLFYLEKKLLECAEQGVKIQVLLLCNPHSPLPQVVAKDVVEAYALLAEKVCIVVSQMPRLT